MSEDRIEGLDRLARMRAPARDLWPAIAPRLRPRRTAQWPLAAAAGLATVGLMLLLSTQTTRAPVPGALLPLALTADAHAIVRANLDIVDDAERQLREALRRQPGSEGLQRLLDSMHKQQHELRRRVAAQV